MDENLTDGGEGARSNRPGLVRTTSSSSIPQIKRWIRTPKAIIMHLTNGTIQVHLTIIIIKIIIIITIIMIIMHLTHGTIQVRSKPFQVTPNSIPGRLPCIIIHFLC